MADRWASSQEDPDQPHLQKRNGSKGKVGSNSTSEGNQAGNQGPISSKKGNLKKKYEEKGKKKFSGNCFVCRKQGHRAQDCYQEMKPDDKNGKGSANTVQAEPSQEN